MSGRSTRREVGRWLLVGCFAAFVYALKWAKFAVDEPAQTVLVFAGLLVLVVVLGVEEVRRRRSEKRERDVARGPRGRLSSLAAELEPATSRAWWLPFALAGLAGFLVCAPFMFVITAHRLLAVTAAVLVSVPVMLATNYLLEAGPSQRAQRVLWWYAWRVGGLVDQSIENGALDAARVAIHDLSAPATPWEAFDLARLEQRVVLAGGKPLDTPEDLSALARELPTDEQQLGQMVIAVHRALRLHASGGPWLKALDDVADGAPQLRGRLAERLSPRHLVAVLVAAGMVILVVGIALDAIFPLV